MSDLELGRQLVELIELHSDDYEGFYLWCNHCNTHVETSTSVQFGMIIADATKHLLECHT